MSETPETPDSSEEAPTEFRTYVEIPEGSMLLGAVEVVSYLDPEGQTRYGFRWPDGMSYSQILGLLDLVRFKVGAHYLADTRDGDDD